MEEQPEEASLSTMPLPKEGEPTSGDWLAELITLAVSSRTQMDIIQAQLEALSSWPERLERRLAEAVTEAGSLNERLEDLRNDLQRELKRIGRHQFKANTLDETRLERWQEAVKALESALARREGEIAALRSQQREVVEAARREWLAALLPILDGLEEALSAGETQLAELKGRYTAWKTSQTGWQGWLARLRGKGPPPDQDALASLGAWLEGLRLLRDRVWAMLEEAGVRVIPTVGQSFNPYLHVAVGTAEDDNTPPGIIVAEQRRGYQLGDKVLRFAEVIVARQPEQVDTDDSVE